MSVSGDEIQAGGPAAQEEEQQVSAEAKDLVTTVVGAKDAVCSTVAGAKAAVSSVVDVAKGAVQEGVEKTRSAVTSSMDAVMGSSLGQKVASGLDIVLEKSEQWVDHYLPIADEELAAVATPVEGTEAALVEKQQQQSYYVRLGSLSTSLQQRAYQHSLGKMRRARQSALESLAQLQRAVDLINYAKQIVDEKLQNGQDKLYQMWLACTKEQSKGQEDTDLAEIEAQALAMSDHLLQQLKSNCSTLLGSIKGLPSSLQNKAQQIYSSMEELQACFSPAKHFKDLSSSAIAHLREKMTKMQEFLDELLEYLMQNVPLDWIVGPFASSGASVKSPDEQSQGE
ncbi:perilipin-3-like [Alligator sinensis]|uniref:Perilipin n=1 Tax=Alligator sinensis TaxID=38654 RepID=A0A1U7SML2_ALLSI|nr:perilipin-3-like [Alligator sinensis]